MVMKLQIECSLSVCSWQQTAVRSLGFRSSEAFECHDAGAAGKNLRLNFWAVGIVMILAVVLANLFQVELNHG